MSDTIFGLLYTTRDSLIMRPPNVIPNGVYLSVDVWKDVYQACGVATKPAIVLRNVNFFSEIIFTELAEVPPADAETIFTLPADNTIYKTYSPSKPEMRLYAKLKKTDNARPSLFVYLPERFGALVQEEMS